MRIILFIICASNMFAQNGRIIHWAGQDITLSISDSIFETEATLSGEMIYSINRFQSQEGKVFSVLSIEDKGEKVFDWIAPGDSVEVPMHEIKTRRNLWMKLCNEHRVDDLVKEMYAKDAQYYNHKPLIIGHEKIIEEYAYMSDSSYQLTLEPIFIYAMENDTIFEIGQCSGTYLGKYILIWQKDEDGQWRIIMDSNI